MRPRTASFWLFCFRVFCCPISLSLNTGFCRPISLSLNTGFCRPISLSLNTGFCRPISLSLNMGFYRPISLSLNTGSFRAYFAIAPYGLFSRLFRYRSIRRFGSGYVLGLAPCAHTPTQLRYCRRQYAQPLAVLSTICPSVTIPHDFSTIDASETKGVSIVLASKILVCTKNYLFLLPYRALLCDNRLVVKTQIGCEEVW